MMEKKKVLIVAPAFNEVAVLPAFLDGFYSLREQVAGGVDLRLLVVDDGSNDGTDQLLRDAVKRRPDVVSSISLLGNFGHQAALIAGMYCGRKWPDAIVTMDCDLEHPFAVIPKMIEIWERDRAVLVNSLRSVDHRLPVMKRLFSKAFYIVARRMTGISIREGNADFRLWDASVIRSLARGLFSVGSLRIFASWLPGKKSEVHYDQHVQVGRRSRFTLGKNLELASVSLVRFSSLPLKAILISGGFGLIFSMVYAHYVVWMFYRGMALQGWSSTVLLILFLGSLNLFALGIMATYLQRLVFSKDLPMFLVRTAEGSVLSVDEN